MFQHTWFLVLRTRIFTTPKIIKKCHNFVAKKINSIKKALGLDTKFGSTKVSSSSRQKIKVYAETKKTCFQVTFVLKIF